MHNTCSSVLYTVYNKLLYYVVIGNDYTLTVNPTTLTFPIGSTIIDTRCVMITLVSDNTVEDSESFFLDLLTPSVGQTGNVDSSVVTINNIGII